MVMIPSLSGWLDGSLTGDHCTWAVLLVPRVRFEKTTAPAVTETTRPTWICSLPMVMRNGVAGRLAASPVGWSWMVSLSFGDEVAGTPPRFELLWRYCETSPSSSGLLTHLPPRW